MNLLDLVLEVDRYMVTKGLDSKTTSVEGLLEMMNKDGLEEL